MIAPHLMLNPQQLHKMTLRLIFQYTPTPFVTSTLQMQYLSVTFDYVHMYKQLYFGWFSLGQLNPLTCKLIPQRYFVVWPSNGEVKRGVI